MPRKNRNARLCDNLRPIDYRKTGVPIQNKAEPRIKFCFHQAENNGFTYSRARISLGKLIAWGEWKEG